MKYHQKNSEFRLALKVFILICLLTFNRSLFAADTFSQGNFSYQITSEKESTGTVSVVGLSSTHTSNDIIIPEEVTYSGKTYTVTSISDNAFYHRSDLNGTLSIPKSVVSIGYRAFFGCRGLTGTLTIPDGVTSIGRSAFDGCRGLTGALTIPDGVTSIGGSAFSGCSGLTGALTIPDGVTSIGGYAFDGCSGFTGTLIIPEGVTSIGEGAFQHCSGFTGTLTIPDGVTSIGGFAFSDCSGLTSFVLPKNIKDIPNGLFFGCRGLTGTLTIPEGVTSIGEAAFRGCRGFTGTLTIPDGVTSIGGSAFSGCSGLTGALTIPDGVTSIGGFAFSDCSGLTSFVLPKNIKDIPNGLFDGCSGFTGTLTIPDGVTSIGVYAFRGCRGLTGALTIPDGVTSIGGYAFRGCSGFTGTLIIPEGVTSIGGYAFSDCSGLTSFVLPKNIKDIPNGLFSGCSGLTGALTIPEGVTSIGGSAFSYCSGLKSIVLPQTVKTYGREAFYGCRGLTHLTIPSSITEFSEESFENKYDELTLPNINNFTNSIKSQHGFNNLFFLSDLSDASDFKAFHNRFSVFGKFYLKPSVYAKFLSTYDKTYSYYPNFTDAIPVTIPLGRNFVTMCRDFDVDFRHTNDDLPSGVSPLKAYIVSDVDEASNAIILQEIKYVPSRLRSNDEDFKGYDEYVGVLLKGTPGYTYYYTIGEDDYTKGKDGQMTLEKALALSNASVPTSSATLVGANDPKYVTTEETIDGTTYKTYGLKNNEFLRYSADGYVPYNKAYLRIPATLKTGAKEAVKLIFHDADGTTTSVSSVSFSSEKNGNDFIYDLQGMKINHPVKGKIYIQDGKKLLQK